MGLANEKGESEAKLLRDVPNYNKGNGKWAEANIAALIQKGNGGIVWRIIALKAFERA